MQDASRRPPGGFPVASLAEALTQLRRPPTAAAVRFKIQSTVERAGQVASYIDARLVLDRLDLVCGERWAARCEELPASQRIEHYYDRNGKPTGPRIEVRCRLTIMEVTREDVGEGRDAKAAHSDALKRAAVHFGVGRALYALRSPWLREGDADGELRRSRAGRFVIDARTDAWLRTQYERWLAQHGERLFGEALDHGDQQGAQGFDDADAGSEADTVVEPGLRAVTDERPEGDKGAASELADAGERAGYGPETLSALGALLFGEPLLERLAPEQLSELALIVEVAHKGRVSKGALNEALTALTSRPDREAACSELRERLAARANEAQLLDRRAA